MKFLAMILLVSSLTAQAQSLRPLKDVMSDMGASLKIVTLGLQAGPITPKMVTESDNIVKFIVESEAIAPDTVLALPNIEQAPAFAKYVQELKDLEAVANDFNAAVKAGNADTAKNLLLQMGNIKKQGHKDFK
jgi:hypothetical protein